MTTTEVIFAAWLFLLTLATIALFAGWIGHRHELASIQFWIRSPREFKPARRSSPFDGAGATMSRFTPGEVIDLSTPVPGRRGAKKPDGGGDAAA